MPAWPKVSKTLPVGLNSSIDLLALCRFCRSASATQTLPSRSIEYAVRKHEHTGSETGQQFAGCIVTWDQAAGSRPRNSPPRTARTPRRSDRRRRRQPRLCRPRPAPMEAGRRKPQAQTGWAGRWPAARRIAPASCPAMQSRGQQAQQHEIVAKAYHAAHRRFPAFERFTLALCVAELCGLELASCASSCRPVTDYPCRPLREHLPMLNLSRWQAVWHSAAGK